MDLFYLITGPVPLTVPVPDQQPFSVGNVLVQMPHVCSVSFHNFPVFLTSLNSQNKKANWALGQKNNKFYFEPESKKKQTFKLLIRTF